MPDPSDTPPADPADALGDALAKAAAEQTATPPPSELSVEPPVEPPVEPSVEPTPPAPPAEEVQAAPPPAEPVPQPTSSEDDLLKLTKFIDQGWGTNLAGKYRDDNATISGLVNAAQLASRRDADAEYGRAVRQHEAAFADFLRQQQQPPPPAPLADQPPTDDQIRAWRDELARHGENASPEARRGAERVQRDTERAILQLTYHPEQLLGPVAKPLVAQETQQTFQQQRAAEENAIRLKQFEDRNKGWMFHGGQVHPQALTPDGQQLLQYAGFWKQRGYSDADAYEHAYDRLFRERVEQQQQQQPAPVQPVSPAAQHQPAVAAPPAGDPEEAYRQDLKLAREGKLNLEEALVRAARREGQL